MGHNRDVALNQLETNLSAIGAITTAIRTYMEVDIQQYAIADLPLIAIAEPEETTFEEMTTQRSVMNLETTLKVYFLHWEENPNTTYKALVKAIRDGIGADFTLSGNATECRVAEISAISGTLPVYSFDMRLEMKLYLVETNT